MQKSIETNSADILYILNGLCIIEIIHNELFPKQFTEQCSNHIKHMSSHFFLTLQRI